MVSLCHRRLMIAMRFDPEYQFLHILSLDIHIAIFHIEQKEEIAVVHDNNA